MATYRSSYLPESVTLLRVSSGHGVHIGESQALSTVHTGANAKGGWWYAYCGYRAHPGQVVKNTGRQEVHQSCYERYVSKGGLVLDPNPPEPKTVEEKIVAESSTLNRLPPWTGARFQQVRLQKKMSQIEVAQQIPGVDNTRISRLENGYLITLSALEKVMRFYGVTWGEMFDHPEVLAERRKNKEEAEALRNRVQELESGAPVASPNGSAPQAGFDKEAFVEHLLEIADLLTDSTLQRVVDLDKSKRRQLTKLIEVLEGDDDDGE